MELILVVVGAIAVTAIAHRRGLEPALIIVVIGIAVSFLPGFEAPELDSHILLTVVLPPLLYSAALNFSFPTFLRNIRPILGLGVGLVVISAFVVAAVSSWLVVVPLSFATALVLGAIVAPPDAVAAIAARILGRSPPGSTTAPTLVSSDQIRVQFCWKGVTGTIPARGVPGIGGLAGMAPRRRGMPSV